MRRSTLVIAALLVAAAGCAPLDDAAVAEGEVTVCAHGPTVQGIDVSSWQGDINWDAVAGSGIRFAIVRIGDGTYRDRTFASNWSNARRVGLIRGAYQFFEPQQDPVVQADIVVAAVGRLGAGDLPVVCDVEAPNPGVSPATYVARLRTWVDRVEAGTGRRPIIYTGRYYWDPFVASSYFPQNGYPLWHAQYTSASCPNINDRWHDWLMWQYTSSGSVPGIGGRVDRNVFNGSLEDLRNFAGAALVDADGDGSPQGTDCDDHDARRHPGAAEVCDGIDNDCQGGVDESLSRGCGTDVGECVAGTQTCRSGDWGACEGSVDAVPEVCDGLDNDCDGADDEEQVCEREEALLGSGIYGPTLATDVDGDGRADACARTNGGFGCLASSGHGFQRVMSGPTMTGTDVVHGARIRMADVDGDGRSDVCADQGGTFRCWRSTGDGFGESLDGPAISRTTTMIELADVSGDGAIDVCMRDGGGLSCWLSNGHGFDRLVTLSVLSDAEGFENVVYWGTLRFGDVNGDGRTDVCARDAEGVDCWASEGERFGARIRGPRWSDAAGFDALRFWSTIRLVDVDADGMGDLCARTPSGFRCAMSTGIGFDAEIAGPPMSDASGWDQASVYTTLRMADVDGDHRADVCARERDRVRCWLFGDHAFDREVPGPALSDADGWADPAYYRSLRLADVDGDARADLCARASDGLHCYVSIGAGFDHVWITPEWADASGLGSGAQSATIRLAGGRVASVGSATSVLGGCSVSAGRGSPVAGITLAAIVALAAARRRRK